MASVPLQYLPAPGSASRRRQAAAAAAGGSLLIVPFLPVEHEQEVGIPGGEVEFEGGLLDKRVHILPGFSCRWADIHLTARRRSSPSGKMLLMIHAPLVTCSEPAAAVPQASAPGQP